MSNIYRIHGARYLRKYTAAEKSSNFAYMSDVRKIANTLCTVPWSKVAGDIPATNTIHTEEGLDWNDPERDRFDAAEWCAEHANGFHRAFAQAACYVFKLPSSAIGTAIQKIRVNVTSDPFNPYGARIAAMASDTLTIPMDCDTVREGDVFRAPDSDGLGAAPRLFKNNADGTQTWYENSEIVELVPGTTLAAKQYLFVFVCLENYNRGRDGWIEGSSYIDNDVEITLASSCSDLVDDELNDLSQVTEPKEFPIVSGGILPDMTGAVSGVVAAIATDAGTVPDVVGGYVENIGQFEDELSPANCYGGLRSVYAMLERGATVSGDFSSCHVDRKRIGVGFNVKHGNLVTFSDPEGNVCGAKVIALTASSMFVPFSIPSWKPSKVAFDWSEWLTGKTVDANAMFSFYLKRGAYVTDYEQSTLRSALFYRGAGSVGGYDLIGRAKVSDGVANLSIDVGGDTLGTFLICAYLPQDSIESSTQAFSKGVGDLFYDYVTPDSILGGSEIGLYSKTGSYSVGDLVRVPYDPESVGLATGSFSGERIAYVGGVFICGGKDGVIRYSNDGVVWHESNLSGISSMRVAEIGGTIVLINGSSFDGDENAYRSNDGGRTWLASAIADVSSYANSLVAFNSCFYAAIKGNGVYRSVDGASWTNVKSSSNNRPQVLCVADDRLYWGGISTTTDGVNWTDIDTYGAALKGVVKFNGKYYLSSQDMFISTDGVTIGDLNGYDNTFFGDIYIVGNRLVCFDSNGDGLWCSNDGENWSQKKAGVRFYDGAFIDGDFYCVSNAGVFVSRNGTDFTSVSSISTLKSIASSGERIVAVGSDSGAYSNVSYGKVYECVQANSGGVFDVSKWAYVGEPLIERCSGADDLCVPDITLIG